MADVNDIARRTDQVATAMHVARQVLDRVGRVLDGRESLQDATMLRDGLADSGRQLQSALEQADALHRTPEYGGTQQTRDLLDKVHGVRQITKNAETGLTRAIDEPRASAAVMSEVRETVAARRQEVGRSTEYAINISNEAMQLAKTAQVAGNPTSRAAQHPAGSAQQQGQRHPQGQEHDSGVQR
ncbi:hypothetical protein ACIA58_15885 [Kribbella sp. NPDC051586]|uniref:hypothetical protein n=1 Tax=Kribbella sp. NPDC051586 TaxID=3364118 RepID=UPI0037911205